METPDPRKQSFTQKFAGDKANLAKAMKDHEAFILRPGQKATLDNHWETLASPTPSLAAGPDLDLEARRDYQRGYIQGRWDATQSLVKQAEALWNSPPILIDAPNIDSKFLASLVPPSPAAPLEGKEEMPRRRDLWMLEIHGMLDPRYWATSKKDAEEYVATHLFGKRPKLVHLREVLEAPAPQGAASALSRESVLIGKLLYHIDRILDAKTPEALRIIHEIRTDNVIREALLQYRKAGAPAPGVEAPGEKGKEEGK